MLGIEDLQPAGGQGGRMTYRQSRSSRTRSVASTRGAACSEQRRTSGHHPRSAGHRQEKAGGADAVSRYGVCAIAIVMQRHGWYVSILESRLNIFDTGTITVRRYRRHRRH